MKCFFIQVCLSGLLLHPAAAQMRSSQAEMKKTAQYWQLGYGVPQSAHSYTVALESGNLDAAWKKVSKLAEESGVNLAENRQQYGYQAGAGVRHMVFHATLEKAEVFCQKVISVDKLKQFSSHKSLNEASHGEIKSKKESLYSELHKNKDLFRRLPIAQVLMSDLLARYEAYLAGYEAASNKAVITVTLSLARED